MNGQTKQRRKRGVILTRLGLQKFQAAKSQAEMMDNGDRRYTLEDLSEMTGVSMDTLTKVFACESGVDKQTLKQCFRTFDLVLESQDYQLPESAAESAPETLLTIPGGSKLSFELPEGQVPLHSIFYIDRPPVENACYRAIADPGALIRIKAPRRMGKSSLMARVLRYAEQQGQQTVLISFRLADKAIFQDLERFLRWFCANVSLGLNLPNRVGDYWDELFGDKISCKMYFEQYLLAELKSPLALGLEDVDRLFQHPELADDFFGLLRAWHEEAKNREIWQKFRLVVAHSIEVYIPLNLNQSPFNVGLPISLQPFTLEQTQSLADRYELGWTTAQIESLRSLVGGHPYLLRTALYAIQQAHLTLEQVLQAAFTSTSIYNDHLQQLRWGLQQEPDLMANFTKVVTADAPVAIDLVSAFRLQSMGLVHLQDNQAVSSCDLYKRYFSHCLA
jgi:hypothetical protein